MQEEKPIKVKRIDVIVHPGYAQGTGWWYNAEKMFKIYKKHVDEVAKHPDWILFIAPPFGSDIRKKDKLVDGLLKYAKRKLGSRRVGLWHSALDFELGGRRCPVLKDLLSKSKLEVDPRTVKTRALGEFMNACVSVVLASLNKKLGMANVAPYRNPQSTILPRESLASFVLKEYPKPWKLAELKELAKTDPEAVRKRMEDYAQKRLNTAKSLAETFAKNELARFSKGKIARKRKPRPR